MAVKFFGQFLLERGAVTREQLLEAVAYQEAKNLKLGDYAVSKGYLTAEQLTRINDEQQRTDMRIGELAVLMGMITRPKLDELLMMQKNDHVMIGEAFVRKGLLTPDVVERELVAFREDQRPYAHSVATAPEGSDDAVVASADITMKMLQRVAHVEAKLGDAAPVEMIPTDAYCAVSVKFSGDSNSEYVLCFTRELAARIAVSFVGTTTVTDADIKDGAREFCNIVCGNVMAVMARKGKAVEISPPKDLMPGSSITEGRKALCYMIATSALGSQALIIS